MPLRRVQRGTVTAIAAAAALGAAPAAGARVVVNQSIAGITPGMTEAQVVQNGNPCPCPAGSPVIFDASKDPDESHALVERYDWDFGVPSDPNGKDSEPGSQTYYTYSSPGTYTVTVTMTDEGRQKKTLTQQVEIGRPSAAAAAARKRYDLCALQRTDAQHVRCARVFSASEARRVEILAGFRDHRARDELYQVCITEPRRVGICTTIRYQRKVGPDGQLVWSVIPTGDLSEATRDPGRYTLAWYTSPTAHTGAHLIGRWRFRVKSPGGGLGSSLPIAAEVEHLFSQASNGHGGVLGYDADGDGAIDRRNESVRTDTDNHSWDADRLFQAAGGNAASISRAAFTTWFGKFDSNHDGRLVMTRRLGHPAGEFASACKAVWGDTDACQSVTLTVFEKDLFG